MSFDEFNACVSGYNKANGASGDMSPAEWAKAEELLEEVEARNAARLKTDGDRR